MNLYYPLCIIVGELNMNGVRAIPYHAGLGADARTKSQDSWIKDKVDVVCATIAFGNF